ncbi:right-handed parallel beta-helix repeat-containing protein, partial [Streptomyces sp. NPDC086787]|uniref:right-handed parallel beta-helix repeat-containing protein n=1 Tax=Streptomyces sp. NPDC086787 TaxID=3365759 RepID=UPI0037FB7C28
MARRGSTTHHTFQEPRRSRVSRALRERTATLMLSLAVSGLAGIAPAQAAAITPVGCTPDPVAAGTLLKNAVTAASPGDTLSLASYCVYGYDDSNKTDATNALVIDKDLTVTGNHASLKRTDGTLRLIHLTNTATLALDTLAVINGNPGDNNGGGISTDAGTTFTATDLILQGNAVGSAAGGGLYSSDSTITLTGGTIKDNRTGPAYYAGGAVLSGTVAFHGVTVTGNRAGASGDGGIYQSDGDLTIDQNSVISNNTAAYAAGIETAGDSVTIINSRVTNNTATEDGGGVYAHALTTILVDSLVSGNTVTKSDTPQGAGIFVGDSTTLSGTT